MIAEEFARAYEKHEHALLFLIAKEAPGDEREILHRALFGRPVKDREGKRERPIAGGMYEDREQIPQEDFLRRAYGYVKKEIRQWYRERQREVLFSTLATRDEDGDRIDFDPSTHENPEPAERAKRDHAERPMCPPLRITCPTCDSVLVPQPTFSRGSRCSCGLAIASGINARYRAPQTRVHEPQNWNTDEARMVARLDTRPWGDLIEKAMADLPSELRELVRRKVIEHQSLEDVARDWQQSPDVVKAELDRALGRLRDFLKLRSLLRPKISLPIACACKSFEKAFPSQDLRCSICGEVRPGPRSKRREVTRWQVPGMIWVQEVQVGGTNPNGPLTGSAG